MAVKSWNRSLGWALLVAGFAWAAWLDPWSLSERDPAALLGNARMTARQAQAVVVGMAFLQLIVAMVLANPLFAARLRRVVAGLTGVGAVIYALGYILQLVWPGAAWLVPLGALLNFVGFAILCWECWTARGAEGAGPIPTALRVILPVICGGMLLDVVMGLFAASPHSFLPAYLGAEDGVRLRMLRLARAAAIALSILTLLYQEFIENTNQGESTLARRGWFTLLLGTAGMSLVLSAAAFTAVSVKYLLPVPALSIFAGTIIGVLLAKRRAHPLEFWGWVLIAVSMAIGLTMGMYAFDGPMPSPLGGYNDFARRLSRLGHAYAIVLGLLAIFVAREFAASSEEPAAETVRETPTGVARRVGAPMLVAGIVTTIVVIVLVAASLLPVRWLGIGPAMVAVAAMLCFGAALFRPAAKASSL